MNPPTDHLPKWQKGQPSPNPKGRPPKFITTLKRQGYHAGDINRVTLINIAIIYFKLQYLSLHIFRIYFSFSNMHILFLPM